MTRRAYELKLSTGEVVAWDGKDGVQAAQSYADSHPGATVVMWREPRHGLWPMLAPIVEPGR
jgi:hypothetical protein